MFRQRSIWPVLLFLSAVSVACSSGGPSPQAVPPTATAGVQPTATLPPVSATHTPLAPTDAPTEPPLPTDTSTPTATATPTPKPRLPVTIRPRVTAAPLAVSYEVVEIKREQGEQATLMLKVNATGGGGGYRYYHDDVAQPGPLFKVTGICGKPFVHTIKVSAANGETVALPYHVGGVCPTPTP